MKSFIRPENPTAMEQLPPKDRMDGVLESLRQSRMLDEDAPQLEMLTGDGSDRLFVRVRQRNSPPVLAVIPSSSNPKSREEAWSCYHIGRHLKERGIPVPEIFYFHEPAGIILMEDLGDCLLHDVIQAQPAGNPEVAQWYREALRVLVQLQVAGAKGFDDGYCWDTPRYDRQLMLERESGYFARAFCRDFLGFAAPDEQLAGEFQDLAGLAAREPAGYLLHRDFQCRNLMIHAGRLRLIDFQGARFGPLGYDLASLLIDPYASLPGDLRDELLDMYLAMLAEEIALDRSRFLRGYYYMVLQRNLQILGAFAFLSQKRGKPFFRRYIRPAAVSLHTHLAKAQGDVFPVLRRLTDKILHQLQETS